MLKVAAAASPENDGHTLLMPCEWSQIEPAECPVPADLKEILKPLDPTILPEKEQRISSILSAPGKGGQC